MRFVKQLGAVWATLERWCQMPWLQYFIITVVSGVTLICVFQPEVEFLRWISNQMVLILLFWLGCGVGFLMLRCRRLAIVCLMSSAALCLYLKNASNISLAAPQIVLNEDSKFTIAHFNLSSVQDNLEEDFKIIDQVAPDILVFQEYTPQFQDQITGHYDTIYSNQTEFLRIDDYGQSVFTSFPVLAQDTFLIYNMPVLRLRLQIPDGRTVQLISQYSLPPLTTQYKEDSKLVFSQLAEFIAQADEPVIFVGTLNYVSWDNQMVRFRYQANLEDSRKSFFPSFANSDKSLFYAPVDHIYYNEYLDCLQFKKIDGYANKKIGIRGEYQINNYEKIFTSTQE